MIQRPHEGEYAADFGHYIGLVPQGELLELLQSGQKETAGLLSVVTEEQAGFRYAPGKWSLKEVLGHVADNERIMSYRALAIARGEQALLPGYDHDEYVAHADFDARTWESLLEEYTAVRQATLTLLRGLTDEALLRIGTANNVRLSARALAYVIAGHEIHHRNVIRERYLQA